MTIFDFISDILFTKKKSLTSIEEEGEFSPFLVNRWISMYSPANANMCNKLNKYLGIFESKKDLYNLFFASFSKLPYKKITYFKRKKAEKDEKIDNIELLAKAKELSQREIKEYIETLKTATS
jgi:hypothetical protein